MLDLHWRYFLALDADLTRLTRYIEFTAANKDVYSVELLRILLAAGTETDVLLHDISARYEPALPAKPTIDDYRSAVTAKFPNFHQIEVTVSRYQLVFRPWSSWTLIATKNPGWWKAYTQTKHHPSQNFSRANLYNALEAVAGLFVVGLTLYAIEKRLHDLDNQSPELFAVAHSPAVMAVQGYGIPEVQSAL